MVTETEKAVSWLYKNIVLAEHCDTDYHELHDKLEVILEEHHKTSSDEKVSDVTTGVYKIQVFVGHGFYEYTVNSSEKAMAHGQAIMSSGVYRRSTPEGDVEFHKVFKVKVKGPDLESQYLDTFCRT